MLFKTCYIYFTLPVVISDKTLTLVCMHVGENVERCTISEFIAIFGIPFNIISWEFQENVYFYILSHYFPPQASTS